MSLRRALLYPVARKFFAGVSLGPALERIKENNALGLGATVDFLGEDVSDASEAEIARLEYMRAIKAIAFEALDASIAIKLTHIGLDISRILAENNALEIAAAAKEKGVFLWVDMEGSEHTDSTISIYGKMLSKGVPAGIALQASLKRTWDDVKVLSASGARIRLVKGAYNEPPEKAVSDMGEIRKRFIGMARYLVDAGASFAIGTHDLSIIENVRTMAGGADMVEYQMLMGLRDLTKKRLVGEGLRVVEYVPYGADWYGYGIRRLTEKKRNMLYFIQGFMGR
jgi:proline dehydrogenase